MDSNYDVITFILEYFILKRLRLTNFADIIKIATLFIKILIKNSNKIKRVINYTLKYRYTVFLDITEVADFRLRMLMPAELKGCVM